MKLIQRFVHNAATDQWTQAQSTSYTNLLDIALTTDESLLVVLTSSQLLLVDPVTMTTTKTVALPQTAGGYQRDVAVTNNGLIIIQSIGSAYSLSSNTFTAIPGVGGGAFITASRDGSRAIFGSAAGVTQPFQYFNTSTNAIFTSTTAGQMQLPGYSRHAERAYVTTLILDANLSTIGTVNQPSYSGDISPDGNTAFALDYPANSNVDLHKYDLTKSPFVESVQTLGTVSALGIGRIAVDPRGNALYVLSEKSFQVISNP